MNGLEQPQIDLSATTAIKVDEGAGIMQQGFLLRKVSKFVANTSDDAILPIPVFYDTATGKIVIDSIPEPLREEYKEFTFEKQ